MSKDHIREERNPLDFQRSISGKFLSKEFPAPVIDKNFGATPEVSMGEALSIREMYFDGTVPEVLALEFNLSEELVMKVVNGEVWPYAGGPLRPLPLNGPNVVNGFTPNQRKFIKGVIGLAKKFLDDASFEIFCEFNGMRKSQGDAIAKDLENLNARIVRNRYRGVLRLHSTGCRIEEAVAAYKDR